MEIWSHRGRKYPFEIGNCLSGFYSLKDLGITGFETDICYTANGEIIIYHPKSTKPDLSCLHSEDIKNSFFNVAGFDDLLDFLEESDLDCCLEIKQYEPMLLREAVTKISLRNLEHRIYITAFQKRLPIFGIESDGTLLLLAKKLNPKIKTQLIVTWPMNLVKIAEKYNPDVLSIGWLQEPALIRHLSRGILKSLSMLNNLNEQIDILHNRKIRVWAGIFNNPDDMIYFSKLGVDGIMTDYPDLLKTMIENKKIPS